MNIQENIQRIRSMMGLLIESTDKLSSMSDDTVLVSDYVKNHIKDHNKFGTGSTFREGISDEEILKLYRDESSRNMALHYLIQKYQEQVILQRLM